MPSLRVLALYVSLAAAAFAADWSSVHQSGVNAWKQRDFAEAARLFAQCRPLSQTAVEAGIADNDLGAALHELHREREAREALQRAYTVWSTLPNQRKALAETAVSLAEANANLSDFAAAEQVLRETLAAPDLPNLSAAALHNTLGDKLRERAAAPEAREHFNATLALSGISPAQRIEAISGLADLDRQARRWKESVAGWNEAIALAHAADLTPPEALALRGLGLTLTSMGELSRAEPVLKRAVALLDAPNPASPQQLANALLGLASLYRREQKPSLAESLLLRALDINRSNGAADRPESAAIMESLTEILALENRPAEALRYAARAYEIMAQSFGPESTVAASAIVTLAIVKERAGDLNGSADDYSSALAIFEADNAARYPIAVTALQRYAHVLGALQHGTVKAFHIP